MKKAIAIIKENKCVGYWSSEHSAILTRTIELWDTEEEKNDMPREFFRASSLIMNKYKDDRLIPVIVVISSSNSVEALKKSADMHLQNIRDHWPLKVELIKSVETSIKNIRALQS